VLDGALATDSGAEQAAIDDAIRQCMKEYGFDYLPATTADALPLTEVHAADRRAYLASQGFGWTTYVGMPGLDPWMEPVTDEASNAQSEYLAALDTGERAEYELAMFGDPTATSDGAETSTDSRWGGGCFGDAYTRLYAGGASNPWNDDTLASELRILLTALEDEIAADLRTIRIEQEWDQCMRSAGFEVTDQEQMLADGYETFRAKLVAIVGEEYMAGPDPFAGWSQEDINSFTDSADDEDWDRLLAEGREQRPSFNEAALSDLQRQEQALALADFDCTEANRKEADAIRDDLKDEFVEAHTGELMAIIERYQEMRASQ